jgi:hypothetical protein
MTAKEKAEELVGKMKMKMPPAVIPTESTIAGQLSCDINIKSSDNNAKLCALIAVDEILKNQENVVWKINKLLSAFRIDKKLELSEKYWQEVKQFIEEI